MCVCVCSSSWCSYLARNRHVLLSSLLCCNNFTLSLCPSSSQVPGAQGNSASRLRMTLTLCSDSEDCVPVFPAALVEYPDTLQSYLRLMSSVCITIQLLCYYMYVRTYLHRQNFFCKGTEDMSSTAPKYQWSGTEYL